VAAIAYTLGLIKKNVLFQNELVLFVRPLDEPFDAPPITGVTVREMQAQDLALFEAFMQQSDVLWYRLLFERGRHCLVALKDGQLAAFSWMAPEIDPRLERLYVPLTPGDLYVIVLETMPPFRRQGLQKLLFQHLVEWGRERGYRRLVCLVATYNEVSLKYVASCGYQPVSRLKQLKIMNVAHFRYTPNLFGKAGHVLLVLG
jgi:GNAT superfamily N-acetyltransferase